jgi:inorganic triphosphatase YgiF
LDGALAPVCRTEISRTVWRVACDGATVEAAIDQGRIRAGQREVPVSELELELKGGEPAALYRLALELSQAAPLAIEPSSKAERGAQLAGRPGPEAVKPGDVALRPDQSAAEAFGRIMGAALGHLRINLAPSRSAACARPSRCSSRCSPRRRPAGSTRSCAAWDASSAPPGTGTCS